MLHSTNSDLQYIDLIRQLVQSVTFSSVPTESLSFVYISVRLIRQFAQFVTSFYP